MVSGFGSYEATLALGTMGKVSKLSSSFSYKGKHILLTGACGGLGMALVQHLSTEAARIVLSDRQHDILSHFESIHNEGCALIPIRADLSIRGEAENLAAKAIEALAHVDIVINNAGTGYHALIEETVEDRIRDVFEINTFSPLALAKALLPAMKYRGSGIIINILSCAGFIPTPTTGIYGASKAAFSSMTRTLRLELEPLGIKVFNFYPGPIATSFNENAMREHNRTGVYACIVRGAQPGRIAEEILVRAAGQPSDIWLDRRTKSLAVAGTIWPKWSDRRLVPVRDAALMQREGRSVSQARRWKLWQIEASIACNLNCIMCPWKDERELGFKAGDMASEIWGALRLHLRETESVDFTGGGEPLLHPLLTEWIKDANDAGCRTGFLTNGVVLSQKKSKELIRVGLDWIGFSVDGTSADVYEKIRKGADFERVCDNIARLNGLRAGKKPLIMINFVLMNINIHQVEDLVRLASKLGVDQINFKQCDVIRGEHGRYYGLFAPEETRKILRYQKALKGALQLAEKFNIQTTHFSFVADEQPVCAQDPRKTLFVRYDGSVAPCINLAIGGTSSFLGEDVNIPTVHYGRLPDEDLMALWKTETCQFYKQRFEQRVDAYDTVIGDSSFEPSLPKLKETLNAATKAMPKAPEGCRVCHYLYDI